MPEPKAKPSRKPAPDRAAVPGVIRRDALYTVDEACRRLHLGAWAWRKMRRGGLKVLRVGGRGYVTGEQLISYMERVG